MHYTLKLAPPNHPKCQVPLPSPRATAPRHVGPAISPRAETLVHHCCEYSFFYFFFLILLSHDHHQEVTSVVVLGSVVVLLLSLLSLMLSSYYRLFINPLNYKTRPAELDYTPSNTKLDPLQCCHYFY